ncbi:hypothetical protein RhiirC2_849149 [Rhizophagus irregularis]|uniref:Uncharacterized protein n=1 Tax=Rhizophagus irregularis TaxID=588596 RepID=A0A2N1NC27_9GLOM|nr:hypothetical protein RhiirC2_849149 [Rhizophagus irregularis]
MAHGIVVDEKGSWSDHDLQHVSILSCEIVICLDFVLDILNETDEIEGNKRKILRLALDEDEYLIKLWKAIKTDVKQVQVLMALSTEIEIEK